MNKEFSIKKQKTGGHWLTVKGDLTVRTSQSLKENLIVLLSHGGQLGVSLQAAEAVDMAGIQLLFAFHKKCKEANCPLSITWPDNKEVSELIEKTGIQSIFSS